MEMPLVEDWLWGIPSDVVEALLAEKNLSYTSLRRVQDAPARPTHVKREWTELIGGVMVRFSVHHFRYVSEVVATYARSGHFITSLLCSREEYWSMSSKQKSDVVRSRVQAILGARQAGSAAVVACDETLARQCPVLYEFLTMALLPDGSARQLSTVLVFADGGEWKAVLHERDAGLNLWSSGHSLQDAITGLELRLCAPSVDWRPSGARNNGKKSHRPA